MKTIKSQEQLEAEALIDRKLMVIKLLAKMKQLKNKKGKPYKDCQKQIFKLVKAGADPSAEVDENATQHPES